MPKGQANKSYQEGPVLSSASTRFAAVLAAFACLIFGTVLPVHADSNQQARKELERLEQKWSNAFNAGDAATLHRLLDSNFLYVGADGSVKNLANYVAMVVNDIHVISGGISGLEIRVHGGTAVVTAVFTGRTSFDGVESDVSFRFIDVWTTRGGRWVAVSSQDTAVPAGG